MSTADPTDFCSILFSVRPSVDEGACRARIDLPFCNIIAAAATIMGVNQEKTMALLSFSLFSFSLLLERRRRSFSPFAVTMRSQLAQPICHAAPLPLDVMPIQRFFGRRDGGAELFWDIFQSRRVGGGVSNGSTNLL